MNADHAHEELLMFMRHTWEDIERTKQRQWSDIYHVMIAQGAIVGLLLALGHQRAPFWLHSVFAIAITLLTTVGIAVVNNAQNTLVQQRALADEYYKMLDHEKIRVILAGDLAKSVGRGTYPTLYSAMVIGSGIFAFVVIFGW